MNIHRKKRGGTELHGVYSSKSKGAREGYMRGNEDTTFDFTIPTMRKESRKPGASLIRRAKST